MTTKFETGFSLETKTGSELSIYTEGEYTSGQDAACDECGRPTECATDDEWVVTFLSIDGVEHDITNETASMFDIWSGDSWRTMTASDLTACCIDFLTAERDMETADDNYLPY